jgi:hypothetical protein
MKTLNLADILVKKDMKTNIKIIFLTLLAIWLVHANSWSQNSNQEKPNVIFIICDDLND